MIPNDRGLVAALALRATTSPTLSFEMIIYEGGKSKCEEVKDGTGDERVLNCEKDAREM